MKCFIVLLALFLFGKYAESYKASVYEHFPSKENTAESTIKKNLDLYRSHISSANSDIVVFPEYGLTGMDLSPLDDYAISIEDNTYNIITELKDMAEEYGTYIVVNILEKERLANHKTKYYNTNLVFARNRTIIAKYRKINLFNNEDKLTPGDEVVTFKTDFGVTFGIFTSFDIFFKKPSRDVLANSQVTDIIYPSSWKSVMPFYASLSVQHGYAAANGVNFLAANYDEPKKGYGGSSIIRYDGKVKESYIGVTSSSKPIVQDLEKISSRKDTTECSSFAPQGLPINPDEKRPNIADFFTEKSFQSSDYNFQDIDLGQNEIFKQICDGDFCCSFNITINEANTNEVYKLVAFDGKESLGGVNRNIRVCSLVACDSSNKNSCGARINGTTRFRVRVEGHLAKNENTFYTPLTLTYDLKPIDASSYCEKTNDNSTYIQLFTQKVQHGVLVYGIYGFGSSSAFALKNLGVFIFVLMAAARFVF